MVFIVDFCSTCGVVLESSEDEEPKCQNCGKSTEKRESRIQGVFEEKEARRLFQVLGILA